MGSQMPEYWYILLETQERKSVLDLRASRTGRRLFGLCVRCDWFTRDKCKGRGGAGGGGT